MNKSSKKSSRQSTGVITNRRASFDYYLGDELVCGLALTGKQVRAARDAHVQLKGAFVMVKNGELWLTNASFTLRQNQKGKDELSIDTSPIKLLATRKQIATFATQKQAGMSIVPLRLLVAGRHIKLVIALGKGKKRYDKRETIKKRLAEREVRRQL
jgi:SsrA-binding protein